MYVSFCSILLYTYFLLSANSNADTNPDIRNLTVKDGDKNIALFCFYTGNDRQATNSCKFVFYNKKNEQLDTRPGETFDIYNCSISVASVADFKSAEKIECWVEMKNGTEKTSEKTPIIYHISYGTSSAETKSGEVKTDIVWISVGAGVVGGAVLIGVITYFILKMKAAAKPGITHPKSVEVEVPINNTDVARYVTQPSIQTHGSQNVQKSEDVGCPVVVVAPPPSRKKKKKEKIPPRHQPEENEEGVYEEIGIVPMQSGMLSPHPPPINIHTLPRNPQNESNLKDISQTNSLQHKKKKPPPPTKPRAGTMQSSAARLAADSDGDQPPRLPNIKRQRPVKEKPKEIAIKEKPNLKLPIEANFLGELNRKLAKQPNVTGFVATTVRPSTPQNDDDNVSYESIDLSKDFSNSREMSQPLIEDKDRRPPQPLPKSKPPKQHEKKPESISNGSRLKPNKHEGMNDAPSSPRPRPPAKPKPTIPVPVKPVKPVPMKPPLPVKSVFTGKSPDELPNDMVKEKWNPRGMRHVPTCARQQSAEDDVSEKSYESMSSDEECEPVSTSRQTQQDKYSDELSSGEEWNDFDYIKVEPPTHNASGSIPRQRPVSPERIYYDPNPSMGYDWQGGASSAQNGSNLMQSGSNSVQSGASSVRSGSNLAQCGTNSRTGKPQGPVKGAVDKPLPPLPQESLYENIEDIAPAHYRGMNF